LTDPTKGGSVKANLRFEKITVFQKVLKIVKCFTQHRFEPGGTNIAGRGAARAGNAHGTPAQSHISPSILVYGENTLKTFNS
jgi:hypothetical protein